MNYSLSTNLASEMILRLSLSDNFLEQAKEFDSYLDDYREEYYSAMLAAMADRMPRESDTWRTQAIDFLKERGFEI